MPGKEPILLQIKGTKWIAWMLFVYLSFMMQNVSNTKHETHRKKIKLHFSFGSNILLYLEMSDICNR